MKAQKTYLVEVITISKNSGHEPLSYFSAIKLQSGTLVRVPMRKSFVIGVVQSSRSVLSAKSDIRRAAFSLKKISKKDIYNASLAPEFIAAAEITAAYYATSTGAILGAVLPKTILDEPATYLKNTARKKRHVGHSKETILLQMEITERFGQYRALVRQSFARGNSVMFIVPTHQDGLRAFLELSRGISEFVHTQKSWRAAVSLPHPILFITTPAGVAFHRPDLDTIIVERENSRAYRTLARPYINWKIFIETWAKKAKKQLVLGDSVLSVEILWREKRGDYGESSLVRWRLPGALTRLVDAKSPQNERGRFEIFSDELKKLLEKAMAENEEIFLFGARKGLAPTTVCGECGTILECENCKAPLVLHYRSGERVYICHACGSQREAATRCAYCKSWKLVPLGIGTEVIARAAKELFPKYNVYILDKDHARNDARAKNIVKKFRDTGGILVGTELAFSYLESVPYSGLVSVDALFSIPDFGINERIFYLVSRLREMTQKESVVQTRNIGKQVLAWAAQGNIIDFYLSEIAERESLLYPPFSVFIKIDSLLPRDKLLKWNPEIYRNSLIIRMPRDRWPDAELAEALSLLGPRFNIKVDPESIL
ncbi:MAG: hypothetical protein HYT69_01870 [Candidatus Zambryskibacteria bacterium]|nr:hypothetical protein [Candidatus Zambryskibacteria bacterium]